jgi:hypothetical protein
MTEFDCFIGVDWSGNKSSWQKGLQVAIARPGTTAPVLLRGEGHKGRWSRESFAQWLAHKTRQGRALVGLDFAFGFPDVAAVIPELELSWRYVAELCHSEKNFYGGRFFKERDALHTPLINSASVRGRSYSATRLRRTEIAAKRTKGATPQTVFNAIGAAQVGPSSISGMRFLQHMREYHTENVAIWPLDVLDNRSVIVEVFPRFFPL